MCKDVDDGGSMDLIYNLQLMMSLHLVLSNFYFTFKFYITKNVCS